MKIPHVISTGIFDFLAALNTLSAVRRGENCVPCNDQNISNLMILPCSHSRSSFTEISTPFLRSIFQKKRVFLLFRAYLLIDVSHGFDFCLSVKI